MANKKTLTDMFNPYKGVEQYEGIVRTMIEWYYNGKFYKVAWCAISMSYMANQLGILDQFGGKNQNCYRMLCAIEDAIKKTGKGKLTYKKDLKKGQTIKRGTVIFILHEGTVMKVGSKKHVTTAYKDFDYKGAGTYQSLGGNQSHAIKVKAYDQSKIYAIFEPDYIDEKPQPEPTPTPTGHTTLRQGDKGAEVKEMQNDLRTLGFAYVSGQEMIADGKFGKITKATVVAFQVLNGLKADGICGTKQTWPMIDKLLDMPKTKVVAFTDVYLRQGPGPGYKSIGVVNEGKTVTYTTISNGWIYIPTLKGWCKSSYFSIPPMTEDMPS